MLCHHRGGGGEEEGEVSDEQSSSITLRLNPLTVEQTELSLKDSILSAQFTVVVVCSLPVWLPVVLLLVLVGFI